MSKSRRNRNHKKRVSSRNHFSYKKKNFKTLFTSFFIVFLIVICTLIVFNLFFVSRTYVSTNIKTKNIMLISKGGVNNYITYGKRGSSNTSVKYSSVYRITAETEDGEIIVFDYAGDALNNLCYNVNHKVEYEVITVFNKKKIKFIKINN